MKAQFEDINSKKGNASFLAYAFTAPAFEFKWHYHPEYELTLITKGKGKRLVGDNYENFEAGDLVLLGPGLPHTWSSQLARKKTVSAIVVQFSEDFISRFTPIPEFRKIGELLTESSSGLHFKNPKSLVDDLERLPCLEGVSKVTLLISILNELSKQKPEQLSSAYFNAIKGEENEKRINKICQYIQRHACKTIDLNKVAAMIHLSTSAFCKFFKRATGKTFSDYVNDIRIGNACHLLTESDKSIGEIAYASGFDSLTYFNRVFLRKKKITPRKFRTTLLASS